tara:strand:+ start:86 stop:238 length:153 start_codon:yes stop_codon:yes gene_type:complete
MLLVPPGTPKTITITERFPFGRYQCGQFLDFQSSAGEFLLELRGIQRLIH